MTHGTLETSSSDLWDSEYGKGGIPSSVRSRPSNVVVEFLDFANPPKGFAALDIGCGSGRNSIYMSEQGGSVVALDFSKSQIEQLGIEVQKNRSLHIEPHLHDLREPWPCKSGSIDIAIDTFCFKHQIEPQSVIFYARELQRCLKSGGRFMLFLALADDGYYRQFPTKTQNGIGTIILDPGNEIYSRLYTKEQVADIFREFEILSIQERRSTNEMHGKIYDRSSAVWYMRKV